MPTRERLVVLMHGAGEIEILVPMLRRLPEEFEVFVDADAAREEEIREEIGRAESLRGGRGGNAEKRPRIVDAIGNVSPSALLTGLHTHEQLRAVRAFKGRVRRVGLIEMAWPSDRHAVDKPGSCFQRAMQEVPRILVPSPLVDRRPPSFKGEVFDYGLPEPRNETVVRGPDEWRLRGDVRHASLVVQESCSSVSTTTGIRTSSAEQPKQ